MDGSQKASELHQHIPEKCRARLFELEGQENSGESSFNLLEVLKFLLPLHQFNPCAFTYLYLQFVKETETETIAPGQPLLRLWAAAFYWSATYSTLPSHLPEHEHEHEHEVDESQLLRRSSALIDQLVDI